LFAGLAVIRKKAPSRSFVSILIALLLLYFVFAFRYTVPDRHAFFLPFYCIAAVIIGLGADVLLRRYNYKTLVFAVLVFTLLPIPVYAVTPAFARKTYKALGQRRQRPYRDEYNYWLWPWKTGYRGAERFANEALEIVGENAIIYTPTTDVHSLLYEQQVKGKRPDVKIISTYDKSRNALIWDKTPVAGLMTGLPLYVVSPAKGYCPAFLLERYDFVQTGVLWKVVERKSNYE
jgi:hypothetical protein